MMITGINLNSESNLNLNTVTDDHRTMASSPRVTQRPLRLRVAAQSPGQPVRVGQAARLWADAAATVTVRLSHNKLNSPAATAFIQVTLAGPHRPIP